MADDDNKNSKRTTVYITLVCIGVVLTTLFVMMLSLNMKVFILLLVLYMIGFSLYNFVYLLLNKKLLDKDVRYDVAMYMSLFNIFFGASLFLLTIVFWVIGTRSGGFANSPYAPRSGYY